MVHMLDVYPRLPQRRPSLRTVPSTERYIAPPAPAVALRPVAPVPEEGLLETLRKLWRRRWLIASWTVVMGLIAAGLGRVPPPPHLPGTRRAGRPPAPPPVSSPRDTPHPTPHTP